MAPYGTTTSPAKLRRDAMLAVALAGAVTGLIGGMGWRLFSAGSVDLAVTSWAIGIVVVASLMLTASLCRNLAGILERGTAPTNTSLGALADRVRVLEEELEVLHGGVPGVLDLPREAARAGPPGQ